MPRQVVLMRAIELFALVVLTLAKADDEDDWAIFRSAPASYTAGMPAFHFRISMDDDGEDEGPSSLADPTLPVEEEATTSRQDADSPVHRQGVTGATINRDAEVYAQSEAEQEQRREQQRRELQRREEQLSREEQDIEDEQRRAQQRREEHHSREEQRRDDEQRKEELARKATSATKRLDETTGMATAYAARHREGEADRQGEILETASSHEAQGLAREDAAGKDAAEVAAGTADSPGAVDDAGEDAVEAARRRAGAAARQEAEARSIEIATLAQELYSLRDDVSRIEAKHASSESEATQRTRPAVPRGTCYPVAYSEPDGAGCGEYAEPPDSEPRPVSAASIENAGGESPTQPADRREVAPPSYSQRLRTIGLYLGAIGMWLAVVSACWLAWTRCNLHGFLRSSREREQGPRSALLGSSGLLQPRAAAPTAVPMVTAVDSDGEDVDVVLHAPAAATATVEVRSPGTNVSISVPCLVDVACVIDGLLCSLQRHWHLCSHFHVGCSRRSCWFRPETHRSWH